MAKTPKTPTTGKKPTPKPQGKVQPSEEFDEEEITDDEAVESNDYDVPEGEEHLFHIEVEKRQFDPGTGERMSKPFIVKSNPRAAKNFLEQAKGLGYSHVKVLHEPPPIKAKGAKK